MEIAKQQKLDFLGVNIISLQLTVKDILSKDKAVQLSIDPKIYYPQDNPNAFSILMTLDLKYNDEFNLFIQSAGNFAVNGEDDGKDYRKMFANSNAPAIMFPYLRAFISTLTSNLGNWVNPIIIPPHFFKGDLEEYKIESVSPGTTTLPQI